MKSSMLLGAAMLAAVATAPAHAALNVPVPTENYITFGGLDWAWAAPCAPYGDSCGVVDMTYQSTQGWRFPTLAEFLARPSVTDFGTSGNFKCASAWFSTVHTHCDYTDAQSGYLFDYGYGITPHGSNRYAETWVVRGERQVGGVPEPTTWAMLITGFGLVGFAARRRAARAIA